MKYIAYGSNMVKTQMAHRCPNAQLLGTGYLPGYRMEFYLHATVKRSRAKGPGVPVAVWEINDADERSLDYYEGFPSYYTKRKATVNMRDGSQIEGMVYIMNYFRPYMPQPSYYNAIVKAYSDLDFSFEIERVLQAAYRRCSNLSRHLPLR